MNLKEVKQYSEGLIKESVKPEIEELKMKTDRINIAQKTVNDTGIDELLDSQIEFNANKSNATGQGVATTINKDIILNNSIEDYNYIDIYFKPATANRNRISQATRIRPSDVTYNNTNTEIEGNSSILNIIFHIDNTSAPAGGSVQIVVKGWFKDNKTLHLESCIVSVASNDWTKYAISSIQGIKKEIITIDPMNYIDTEQGIQDTPVGELITKIGSKVPAHYLLCDGTEYNITDYPYLAQAIKDEFGTFNYYGGDGTTTFAVPNKPSGKFIKRLNPIMTSNTAPAGSILYSPSTAGKNLVYYAFKEQSYPGEGECWVCPGNSGYLGYEFVSHTTVNAYRLQPRLYMDSNTLISTPNSWDFQASNDLSTWDTLDSQTGITWSNTDEKKTFFFKNETPYKAYRIFVKINNGSNYVIIGNLQLGTTEVENSSFIKYEPTYFVGSINGYEQVEELLDTSKDYLFNGLNTTTVLNDLITLKDSIENYDKLEIVGQIIDINGRVGYIKNESVRVSGLTYNTSNSINECNDLVISTRSTNALFQSDLLFNFKDANTLRVIRIGLYSTATGNTSWQSFRIKSIRGIRHRYTVSSK